MLSNTPMANQRTYNMGLMSSNKINTRTQVETACTLARTPTLAFLDDSRAQGVNDSVEWMMSETQDDDGQCDNDDMTASKARRQTRDGETGRTFDCIREVYVCCARLQPRTGCCISRMTEIVKCVTIVGRDAVVLNKTQEPHEDRVEARESIRKVAMS